MNPVGGVMVEYSTRKGRERTRSEKLLKTTGKEQGTKEKQKEGAMRLNERDLGFFILIQ